MTLIKFEPMRDLENLSSRIQRMFGDFPVNFDFGANFQPRVDISEDDNSIIVEAEIPGITKEELKLSLQDNILTLSGEKKVSKEENKEKNYYRTERTFGSFTRSFTLPEEVNPDKVEASFENGVLKIAIEKAAPKQVNKRMIEVK